VISAAPVTSAAAVTASAAPAPASLFSRPGFIHGQSAALPIFAIQGGDGSFGGFLGIHRGEGEAARAASLPIHHDVDFIDGAMRCEQVAQVIFSSVKR
jgi:hypothetical protein